MTVKEEPFCTCGYFQEEWLHHVECGLWDDIGFVMGDLKWDWRKSMLVDAPYSEFGRSDECWDMILETQDEPLVPDEAIEALDNNGCLEVLDVDDVISDFESWKKKVRDDVAPEVVGLVTEEEWVSNEGPEDLKCFCWEEAKGTWCGPCGLTRNSVKEPWKKNYSREQAEKQGIRPCTCEPECGVYCQKSRAQRWTSASKTWVYWNPDAVKWKTTTTIGSYTPKCRHYGTEITFPDGTVVYASSLKNNKKVGEDLIPDLGIYMAGSWTPSSVAFHLGWQDFGLPTIPDEQVKWILDYGIDLARNGKIVEIGCVGGHGRTGSVMALMALSCGVPDPEKACEWVWNNYCKCAIEGDKQEWYIKHFSAQFYGTEEPEPLPVPKPAATPATVITTSTSHAKGLGSEDEVGIPANNGLLSGYGFNSRDWEDLMGLL